MICFLVNLLKMPLISFFLLLFIGNNGLSAKNFSILYEEADSRTAKKIEKVTIETLAQLQADFGLIPDSFTIILAADKAKFDARLSKDFPYWGIAAAKYAEHEVILQSLRINRQSLREFDATLRHELAHIALEPLIRDIWFPRWLNEGLAQYIAGQYTLRHRIAISQRALSGQFIPLNKIDDVLKFDQVQANLAYAQSISAVNWLIEEFGVQPFRIFLENLPIYQDSDSAFEASYEFSLELFEISWARWAKKHYRPYFLLELPNLLWLLMPLLVLAGWLRLKYRNRRTVDRWELEEHLRRLPPKDPFQIN
ncbi:MAG TPA: hypothetical protein ENN84_07725 [Candidatus Marinimicrobia bacterium]|nr:hypothetical protein [Candidatus Neomarinimicrobiota bacterium]